MKATLNIEIRNEDGAFDSGETLPFDSIEDANSAMEVALIAAVGDSYSPVQIQSGLERIQEVYEGWALDDVDIDMLLERIHQSDGAVLSSDVDDELEIGNDFSEGLEDALDDELEIWLDEAIDGFNEEFSGDNEPEETSAGVQTNGANTEMPQMGDEVDLTMNITKNITPEVVVVTPAKFESVSLTFTSEAEYQDVVAALAAYGRKSVNVSGTSIAADYKLTKYSGNARRTVNQLLTRLP